MSRDSCESAFNDSLACFARFAIKAKLPEEDDGLLVFFAAAASLAAGREMKPVARFA